MSSNDSVQTESTSLAPASSEAAARNFFSPLRVSIGMSHAMVAVETLTDAEIDRRLQVLVRGERRVLVVFLAHLGEFDRRRAHEPASFTSLFVYCTKHLGLSEAEAYLRIRAARVVRDHPEAMSLLAAGDIHLSSLSRLSPHITVANAAGLLAQARGKTRRQVERIALDFESCALKADVVRALPPPPPDPASQLEIAPDDAQPDLGSVEPPPAPPAPDPWPSDPPLSGPPAESGIPARRCLVRIAFTASEELLAGLERARALLRHKHPDGRLEHVIGEAIESLLDARDPQRGLERRKVRGGRTPERARSVDRGTSRSIPQRVRDEVWSRDGGRCSFVSIDGRRCEATDWLEFDHIRPWAMGGRSDAPENIRILCRTHNQLAARKIFGPRNGC